MGCGSSSSASDVTNNTKNTNRKILVEPQTDPADFPLIPDGYPPPKPSQTKKATLFEESKYTNIEKRAMVAPEEAGNSFAELFEYLFDGLKSDLEKVRAIFCWIGHKNQTSCKGGPEDSPNAILQQVQHFNMSFAYMFARLCREANIPCVIIMGVAKSARYEVGDDEDKVRELHNRWNGVFVAGEWRIVFPHWAFAAVAGHNTGKFTLVEAEGNAAREKQTKSTGVSIVQLNEYYFLPDPEDFVNEAMAIDPKWQFIAKPFNMKKFSSVPLLQESYFDRNVEISHGFNSRLYSEYGVVTVGFKARNEKWDVFLTYELYFNDEESKSILPTDLQLDKYVVMERNFEKWTFSVRCPVTGVYKLCIYLQSSSTAKTLICEFKMFCDEITEGGTKALPLNVGPIGWGPSYEMVKAGLTTPSQSKGIVKAKAKKEVHFSFSCSRTVAVRTVLVHNERSSEELQSYVSHKRDKKTNKLDVAVCVPDEGEYALQIHTKDKNTNTEQNACNYIISTEPTPQQKKKKKRENVTERKARADMKTALTGNDLDILTASIAKFEAMGLGDKGDLEEALKRQNVLRLEKGLNEAIMRRHIDTLDTAIDNAEKSEFKSKLAPKIEEADQVRKELIKLNRFAHDILAMRQPTVSELHSYKIHKPPVMDVMVATFTLLGVPPKYNLEEWQDIRTLLRMTGSQSLIRRVKQFPEKQAHTVDNNTALEVQNMIRIYDEETVRLCSPAAGTFYVWVNNIVTDIMENGNTRNKG